MEYLKDFFSWLLEPEGLGFVLVVVVLVNIYLRVPEKLKLEKNHPRVKAIRKLQLFILLFVVLMRFINQLELDGRYSKEAIDNFTVLINCLAIVYVGNIFPKVQLYKGTDSKNSIFVASGEKVLRKASKIFSYSSFIIAGALFGFSFLFDATLVIEICQYIWLLVPFIYILYYVNHSYKKQV